MHDNFVQSFDELIVQNIYDLRIRASFLEPRGPIHDVNIGGGICCIVTEPDV